MSTFDEVGSRLINGQDRAGCGGGEVQSSLLRLLTDTQSASMDQANQRAGERIKEVPA